MQCLNINHHTNTLCCSTEAEMLRRIAGKLQHNTAYAEAGVVQNTTVEGTVEGTL